MSLLHRFCSSANMKFSRPILDLQIVISVAHFCCCLIAIFFPPFFFIHVSLCMLPQCSVFYLTASFLVARGCVSLLLSTQEHMAFGATLHRPRWSFLGLWGFSSLQGLPVGSCDPSPGVLALLAMLRWANLTLLTHRICRNPSPPGLRGLVCSPGMSC